MLAATEAVIKLLFSAHRKRRGLFLMKRAASYPFLALVLKRYVGSNDRNDIDACQQVIDESLRNSPGHGVLKVRMPGLQQLRARQPDAGSRSVSPTPMP